VRDHHSSEDIAQDVFVAVHGKLGQLRVPSLFGRWVLRIARQRALQAVRSRRSEVSLDHAADVVCPVNESAADLDHLLNALMRLPEREQRLLMLRYFNGHSIAEISRITARPVGTVTKQLSRGYARLREHLSEVLI
jgi:RNA polymerase sigma factor (sigma-70 family)